MNYDETDESVAPGETESTEEDIIVDDGDNFDELDLPEVLERQTQDGSGFDREDELPPSNAKPEETFQ